ncbi:two-component sensor histidine kinase [Paractinoplanes abujensis]|uniref:histidine kinase n=1 Tax=Paractinoplanes abujensis TaxID=882441 RepID=A0A7W7G053_9ACTN|nr:histidine kinase [Actinoplanes abujensis]MBB4692768.1 signal transduction histidine kinase [Actinoplanes abujensis]GID22732.1 two-component sensor histidine kinase [Actinoplanes abujensis]
MAAALVAAIAQCAAFPLAVRRPWLGTLLQFAGVVLSAWARPGGARPLPEAALVVLAVYLGWVALRHPWRTAVVSWWSSVLLTLVLVLLDPAAHPFTDDEATLIVFPVNSMLVLFAAMAWRQRGAVHRQLAAARRDVELEQAQRALVSERNRIARELHDIVAHTMAVIHMQATSAAYRITDIDQPARAEFGRIAAGTRAAMREMRQLLALLRDETDEAARQPAPDLRHLGDLAASARLGGVPVDLDVPGDLEVPGPVGLAAYRIVQESLSNVIRHAPGAATRVRVVLDGEWLLVEIVNDVPARPPPRIESADRARHGLVGMRERARLAGGTLQCGPRPGGGYRVAFTVPV